jgi:lipopolysaccharide transport system permease protein
MKTPPPNTEGSDRPDSRESAASLPTYSPAYESRPETIDRPGSERSGPATARPVKTIRAPSFSANTVVSGILTLARHTDLLYTLTLFRLNVRYKQSILGWIWAALQPLALMTIYTFVFAGVAKVPSEGVPYPVFVYTALLPWIFFSNAILNAMRGLVSYPTLLTTMYFPREIIPLSYVAAALIDFGIAFGILTGLMAHYGISLNWNVLYAVPIIALLSAFTTAIALFLSSVQVRFRDVGFGAPLLFQIGMFATPIVYPLSAVPARFQRIYLLNPVASLVDAFRRVVLHGTPPDAALFATSAATTLLCLTLAYGYFKAVEATMADVI